MYINSMLSSVLTQTLHSKLAHTTDSKMDTAGSQAALPHVYQDFEPSFKWERENEVDTLRIELSGFQKEQLRAQLPGFGNIKFSGERPLGDNKWSRFSKEFPLSSNYNAKEIRARFENSELLVTLPKIIKGAVQENESKLTKPAPEAPTTKEPKKASPSIANGDQKIPRMETAKEPAEKTPPIPNRDQKIPRMETTKEPAEKTPPIANGDQKTPTMEKESSDYKSADPGKTGGGKFSLESYKQAIGDVVTGMKTQQSSRGLIVNLVVASLVVVGLGIYLAYKIRYKGVNK